MSIVAYTGLPGSGKSYSVVEHQILPALKQGRTVVTNIPLHMERITEFGYPGTVVEFPVASVEAEPHKLYEYVMAGCVFVLDEAWRLFPQGQQANKVPDEYKKLLAEHRHMVDEVGNSTQIVLVVQDLANIGAFARRLVENTFVTTKLGFVGLNGSYRVDVFHGAQTGATPSVSNRLRMITGRYRKDIFRLYRSHTMAADADQVGVNEQKIDGRANILMRPAFVIGVVAVPVLLWFSIHTFSKAFHGFSGPPRLAGPALSSSGPDSHSGAKGAGPVAVGTGPGLLTSPQPRLLLEVRDARNPGYVGGYLAVPGRVIRLQGSDCRSLEGHVQCLYRGQYFDSSGVVDSSPQKPIAAWTATPGVTSAIPKTQGAGP